MDAILPIAPRRIHLTRLMSIWRSAGWPCRDAIEIDLLAAGWVAISSSDSGHETLRLTDAGIRLLADSRQRNQRASSTHNRLAERVAQQLAAAGRIVWRELSLRAAVSSAEPSLDQPASAASAIAGLIDTADVTELENAIARFKTHWRMARPDVFSVRNTTVKDYLQPMVHEVKVSRADLLSDLRHTAKRDSYRWLCCECSYVFPVGVAEPSEIPEPFGVWLLHGSVEDGQLELARPARHMPCDLPFSVWMSLAKASPTRFDGDASQRDLGAPERENFSRAPTDD